MRRRLTVAGCVLAIAALAMAGQATTAKTNARPATTYVVQRGDTLSSIAATFSTSTAAIASANNLRNRNVVVIGRRLTIPRSSGGSVPSGRGVLPAKLRARPERLALRPVFVKWARHYGVPADLLEGIAWVESGWQSGVVSRTGAIGIGQLQPDTVALMSMLIGIHLNPYSASDNIRMSARFLRYLLDRTHNNVSVSVAAYYQGYRSVTTSAVLAETLHYVQLVLAVRPAFG